MSKEEKIRFSVFTSNLMLEINEFFRVWFHERMKENAPPMMTRDEWMLELKERIKSVLQ